MTDFWADRRTHIGHETAGELAKKYNRKNYRLHPEIQRRATEGSLDDLGWIGAVSLSEITDELFDGHLRVELALIRFGPDYRLPVDYYDLNGDETRKALMYRDLTAQMAEINLPMLTELRFELPDFDNPAFDEFLASEFQFDFGGEDAGGDTEPQIDRAAELQEVWQVQPGDIWACGDNHKIIYGDCTDKAVVERLMGGERADLVVTDPPYGVSYADKNKFLNVISPANHIETPIENDHNTKEQTQAMWKAAFSEMSAVMSPGAVIYCFMPQGGDQMMMMMMMMGAGIEPRHELIWLKNNHVLGRVDYAYKHEPILYAWKDGGHKFYGDFQTSILEYPKPQLSDLHPTQKPVALIERLVSNSSRQNEVIYDPFLGSGTTLIACQNLNRCCRGIEIHPPYVSVCLQRYLDHTSIQPVLLERLQP